MLLNNGKNIVNSKAFLVSRKLREIETSNFERFLENFSKNDLGNLKSSILNSKLELEIRNGYCPRVGCFNTLSHLIETFYNSKITNKNQMTQKFYLLQENIFMHRFVYGDGNCFYRSVIFSFLEQLILLRELSAFKNIIFDVKNCFENQKIIDISKKIKSIPKIEIELIILIK